MDGLEESALSKWALGWKAAKVGKNKGQEEITRERLYLGNFQMVSIAVKALCMVSVAVPCF